MTWLAYAFLGITIWSVAAIGDRYFLLSHVKSKRFYVVVPALLQFIVTLPFVLWFSVPHASTLTILAAFGSGLSEAIFLYYLYIAVSSDEISRVFSLSTAGPIVTLIAGWLLLHESLTGREFVAFALFIIGGFFVAARFGGGKLSMSKAFKPLFVGTILSSAFTILLRYAFVSSDFWTGFFYSRLGFFVGGLIVLAIYRTEIFEEWRSLRTSLRVGIIGNQLVSVSGHAFYFLAISLANAALVQALLGAQSAIILVFAVIISMWNPALLEESIKPRDLAQKGIGIAFVVAASYLLAI